MDKIERSDEEPAYARMKEVLSEMIASMHYQEDKNVFNVADSSEESSSGIVEEEDGASQLFPQYNEDISLIDVKERGRTPVQSLPGAGVVHFVQDL